MATFHLALDAIDSDFTLAATYGEIVGIALSLQGLRDQGFAAATYTGNRLSTIEHTDAGWNADCEPGWYRTPNGVQIARPLTQADINLEAIKVAFRALHTQLHVWADGLDSLARGQEVRLVQAGHNWLYYAHYGAYLVGSNLLRGGAFNNLSDAQRIAWANRMAQGAADVTSPFEFYQREGAITDTSHVYYNGPTAPASWVNPSTGVALNLADSLGGLSSPRFWPMQTVDIMNVNLANGGWIESIAS